MFLECFPSSLQLHQEIELAVGTVFKNQNYLLKESFSSQYLTEMLPINELSEIAGKVPQINIRIQNSTNELVLSERYSDAKDSSLFSITADVYYNGVVIQCTVEKAREREIRQMLDNILLREGI